MLVEGGCKEENLALEAEVHPRLRPAQRDGWEPLWPPIEEKILGQTGGRE